MDLDSLKTPSAPEEPISDKSLKQTSFNPDQKYIRRNLMEHTSDLLPNQKDGFYEYFNVISNRPILKAEIHNGKLNGFCIKYYENGQARQCGYFVDNKINGEIKEYCEDGKIKYEGGYMDGKYHGQGKYYYYDKGIYNHHIEGDYFENVLSFGKYFYKNKLYYEGCLKNGKLTAEGTFYHDSGELKYDGKFKLIHDIFDIRYIRGTFYYKNGDYILGNFEKGDIAGEGKIFHKTGEILYDGEYWSGNFPEVEYNPIQWGNDIVNFKHYGKYYFKNGNIMYDGYFYMKNLLDRHDPYQHRCFNGKGKLYYEDGSLKYEGNFKSGEYHGYGTLYDNTTNTVQTGMFKKGVLSTECVVL